MLKDTLIRLTSPWVFGSIYSDIAIGMKKAFPFPARIFRANPQRTISNPRAMLTSCTSVFNLFSAINAVFRYRSFRLPRLNMPYPPLIQATAAVASAISLINRNATFNTGVERFRFLVMLFMVCPLVCHPFFFRLHTYIIAHYRRHVYAT